MPVRSLTVLLFLSLISTNSLGGDLFDMLKRMSEADQKQNYQGTFILRKSDKLSTLRVTHGIDENGDWESLEALNGEPRNIFRHNNRVVSIYPARELVTIRHTDGKQALHPRLPENIDQLELFYTMDRLDDDRIADHPALVVDLQPKDRYRYGYRYWVDKNTGMLLRCDLVSEDNAVVEQMMFTSLEYLPEKPAHRFEMQQFKRYKQKQLDEVVVEVMSSEPIEWAINQLPQGFMLTQRTMRHSKPASSQPQEAQPDLLHMVYSDGLASVSVFIEKNQGSGKHVVGASTMGAVNAFGHPVGDSFVTVVGEVPVKTVKSMAQSTVKVAAGE